MKDTNIIVSETIRPFWQVIVAALFFTSSFILVVFLFYIAHWNLSGVLETLDSLIVVFILILGGISFCSQKRVYVDLKNSRFKPTIEIGNFKYGQWKTIHDYEYISIFYDPSVKEDNRFEVNLWYDKNKYFELYSRNNFEDAVTVAYGLSEALDIDLLDATIPSNFKWIDKDTLSAETK